MLVTYQREKLLNAMIFFVKETKSCRKMKMFKLLFFLDFKVFRETGRSVTGLMYEAWERGPVPNSLWAELKSSPSDLDEHLNIRIGKGVDPDDAGAGLLIFQAKKEFDPSWFSEHELEIMRNLAFVFRDATATQMSEISHLPATPWHRVYEVEKRKGAVIPYLLALDDKQGSISRERAEELEAEAESLAKLFG
jgi:uncharacterized phage-associated protein